MPHGAVEVLEKRRTAPMGDRGMIVAVVSWILLVAMIFTLITRLAMKFAVVKRGRKFGSDDAFIVLAALFSVGQTAAASMEAMHALGQHVWDVSPRQMRIFEKAEYSGCLLSIANMGCARISVCILIMKVLPGNAAKRTALAFAIFSALWTISGVLVTAFPCQLPHPWEFFGRKCIDIIKFVNYIGITNIVVEVILILIPLVIWNLPVSAGRSISVSCMFLSRLSVVAAIAAQLVFLNRHAYSKDITYEYWSTALCQQIAQNLSIITACLPCLHPFILDVLSGTIKAEEQRLPFPCPKAQKVKEYVQRRRPRFDPTGSASSQSSTKPLNEKEEPPSYLHPLATYGLDRSSAHVNSQHFTRFPSNAPTPIEGPSPPENVFMRSIAIPEDDTRPPTSCSEKRFPFPSYPKSLAQVGVLPVADWDTEGSDGSSERSNRSRNPDSQYVFDRAKVISVPEANAFFAEEAWRKYPSPPKSGEK